LDEKNPGFNDFGIFYVLLCALILIKKHNHVHHILHLLKKNPAGYTVEDLLFLLQTEFGKDARFTTCGDHSLDCRQAIDFVLIREKAVLSGGKILIN
jgi:probable metal-binding protein